MFEDWTAAGLWLAVVISGIYHGVNPGMGWPLAVSAGLMGRGKSDVVTALGPLALGHFLAMAAVLLPFGALVWLVRWQREIQVAAGLVVIGVGVYLFFNRRHPRILARIRPTQLALWSFAIAMAHGAGLMLVPIYLGLCRAEDLGAGHRAALELMGGTLGMALAVSIAHALAMICAGGLLALVVYQRLGPQFISRSWFNLDVVWALTLIVVGALGLVTGLRSHTN